ncbi:TFIIB-type zinc ribbon-containing protein [Kineococcus sp. LSe6-4]|uniref:TFIIB-type zinc ribbon-containing protein n=1 Tax=Kineococcus halophytocola TaxID=3234027 RepID=A0ABV4GV03_9ACTN
MSEVKLSATITCTSPPSVRCFTIRVIDQPPGRFREPEGGIPWLDPVLVVCPRCSKQATVTKNGRDQARLLCPHCTLTRHWSPSTSPTSQATETGTMTEPRFGLPLWLQIECCGRHLLWATNQAHLDYLASYIGATLRERPPPPSNLAWRLPAWMKHAKNRPDVMRAIGRLRDSLD